MSDEKNSGTEVPQATSAPSGAFDWLIESHQQSAPMAPLTDDFPAPAPAAPSFGMPDPAARPAPAASFTDLFASAAPAEPFAAPSFFAPPAPAVAQPLPALAPAAPVPPAIQPVADATPPVEAALPVRAAPPVTPPVWSPPPRPSEPAFVQAPVAASPTTGPPAIVPPATVLPVAAAPVAPMPIVQAPIAPAPQGVFSFASEPLAAASFAGGLGDSAFALERHEIRARSGNGPLNWVAFILAFLAPPIGLLLAIGAVVSDSRTKGYAAGIAKAAIGIGAALSVVLGVAFAVVTKINNDQSAHASIVASSRAWCTKLESNPATLSSDTFGWPSPGDTIPASITKITAYEAYWDSLVKLAPPGILSDTQKVAAAATSIVTTVQQTQTLNDSGNVAQLQNVVATSDIHGWVSNYCN